jgi:hypothetical protein
MTGFDILDLRNDSQYLEKRQPQARPPDISRRRLAA